MYFGSICAMASAWFLSHKLRLGQGMISNRSLMLGRIGSPVSWSSSSSSSISTLKRRDGGVFSSLLLLMSMSLNGEPGSVRVESGESGGSSKCVECSEHVVGWFVRDKWSEL